MSDFAARPPTSNSADQTGSLPVFSQEFVPRRFLVESVTRCAAMCSPVHSGKHVEGSQLVQQDIEVGAAESSERLMTTAV